MNMITVFEYAELQSYNKSLQSSKRAYVTKETLEWLVSQYQSNAFSEDVENPVITDLKRNSFKLGSYIGYIQSPFNNERIHVLPKIDIGNNSSEKSYAILKKMLSVVYELNPKSISIADLDHHHDLPLHEWIIKQFLLSLQKLLHGGLRSDYQLVEDNQSYLRGRLLVSKQIRKAPGQNINFELEYDDFNFNGVENRLIKTTLNFVLEFTCNSDAILMAYDLSLLLEEIQPILNPVEMLGFWRENRLYESYGDIKKWIEIILLNIRPSFQHGSHKGISLLFSMPQLFEKYVAKCLHIDSPRKLHIQPSRTSLAEHTPLGKKTEKWFRLKPDLLITENRKNVCILDTKWKLIDERKNNYREKYYINQSDLYQMFAYGHKYFDAEGQLILIYPKHSNFKAPLPCFYFSDRINLKVIPFDIEKGCLVGENCLT